VAGGVWVKDSEPCTLTLGPATVRTKFLIAESALDMQVDGLFSWEVCKQNLVEIDAQNGKLIFLEKLPSDIAQWRPWSIMPVPRRPRTAPEAMLRLAVPQPNGTTNFVCIDTGGDDGVRLCSRRLRPWRAANPKAPVTLNARYFPGYAEGLVVREEYWAANLDLAEYLRLSNVPVAQCSAAEDVAENYEATLGLFALSRFKVILDGPHDVVYLRPRANPTNSYAYNRLGAVFTPRSIRGGPLLARVVKNSPAYEVGVRDGDILTRVGELDATQWQTDPRILPLSRFWSQPAGTPVSISCQRSGTNLNFRIKLREIFPVHSPRS
jgi:hypothetical protein